MTLKQFTHIKRAASLAFILASLCACTPTTDQGADIQKGDLTTFVDLRIGTGGHGHTFMGANVPFGFVQLGPTSILEDWDWCSGYNVADSTVIGFSHTHLSGTGVGELADVTLMPVVGAVTPGRGAVDNITAGQASIYAHASEEYAPGYYAVHLDRYDVDVAMSATTRGGFHQYTYPQNTTKKGVIIDLENGTCEDEATETNIYPIDKQTLLGIRNSKGWADDQRLSFAIQFDHPIEKMTFYDKDSHVIGHKLADIKKQKKQVRYMRVDFNLNEQQTLKVKVGLSPVDKTHALNNIAQEMPTWDIEAIKKAAHDAWDKQLHKIEITSKDTTVLRNFYTAMYHTMIAPSVFMEIDGSYRGADKEVYQDTTFVNYTTFSLWDTYRAQHPLMTIIHPDKVSDIVNTMLRIYDQQGKLPVWHFMGCETNCMVGNPAIIVVADAILKGFDGFDKKHALEAMKITAMLDERGQTFRKQYGFIPSDLYNESIANDMEYAIADASLAKVAEKLGDTKAATYFEKRSHSWMRYFDDSTNLARGRFKDGSFRTPFDPFYAEYEVSDYKEGNAFQYTWLVPHDLDSLTHLMGGKQATVENLNLLFETNSKITGDALPDDITGLIGQYVHGNEPSHHILYFYSMLGHPEHAALKMREVFDTLYHDKADGLSGNEDVGQMSAWYVLSSIGLYQVDPSGGEFVLGFPRVDGAVINFENGKTFEVEVHKHLANPENKACYVSAVSLNGQAIHGPSIGYQDIMQGGKLVFEMTDQPASWMNVDN